MRILHRHRAEVQQPHGWKLESCGDSDWGEQPGALGVHRVFQTCATMREVARDIAESATVQMRRFPREPNALFYNVFDFFR